MNLIKSGVVIASLMSAVLSNTSVASHENEVLKALKAPITKSKADSAVIENVAKSKLELMAKLAKIDFFSAQFEQKIFDETGNELQQGSGLLFVSKPNLVNWHTSLPDESLIVSDGENLWFYDPFVEQVSVYTLESAIANTPILLITSDDEKLWQDYRVTQLTEHRYLITAKNENSRVKSLALTFSETADKVELSAFNILDATGQLSVITLTHQSKKPNPSLFTFEVPEGVYLDDQR